MSLSGEIWTRKKGRVLLVLELLFVVKLDTFRNLTLFRRRFVSSVRISSVSKLESNPLIRSVCGLSALGVYVKNLICLIVSSLIVAL